LDYFNRISNVVKCICAASSNTHYPTVISFDNSKWENFNSNETCG